MQFVARALFFPSDSRDTRRYNYLYVPSSFSLIYFYYFYVRIQGSKTHAVSFNQRPKEPTSSKHNLSGSSDMRVVRSIKSRAHVNVNVQSLQRAVLHVRIHRHRSPRCRCAEKEPLGRVGCKRGAGRMKEKERRRRSNAVKMRGNKGRRQGTTERKRERQRE